MLNRNLVKAGFFSPVLLLLFPVVTAMRGEPKSQGRAPLYISWLNADTNQQSLFDSSGFMSNTEAYYANAPKISLNRHASKFVKEYLVKEDEALQKAKLRGTSYFKMMDAIFIKYGLPIELKYLAVVESDLKTSAVSRVGAKGLWQFMPQTARDLGLKITYKYDERKHAYKSTVAAAKYLKDLYAQFNDWLLVLAAYNSGPLPVMKAIKKSGSKNFWAIQYYLPEESRGHVKRFIGTHYYFEGKGSMVTLTKAETTKYLKEMEDFKASIQAPDIKKDSAFIVASFSNSILLTAK
ncbi:MAG TPA: lytic transglycosylase domain-containing protein [Flavisolibacter sp.]|nr:lytic transglycosylase domain-containing protein [Flavisolibacter sp.]